MIEMYVSKHPFILKRKGNTWLAISVETCVSHYNEDGTHPRHVKYYICNALSENEAIDKIYRAWNNDFFACTGGLPSISKLIERFLSGKCMGDTHISLGA